jgi:hypothetical protein
MDGKPHVVSEKNPNLEVGACDGGLEVVGAC